MNPSNPNADLVIFLPSITWERGSLSHDIPIEQHQSYTSPQSCHFCLWCNSKLPFILVSLSSVISSSFSDASGLFCFYFGLFLIHANGECFKGLSITSRCCSSNLTPTSCCHGDSTCRKTTKQVSYLSNCFLFPIPELNRTKFSLGKWGL